MTRYRKATGFLLCRSLGHAWDVVDALSNPRYGGEPVWLRCQRCDTERHDAVSGSTAVSSLGRSYVYDDGYRHAFDSSFDVAPTKSDYRLRLLLADDMMRRRAARALQNQEGNLNASE